MGWAKTIWAIGYKLTGGDLDTFFNSIATATSGITDEDFDPTAQWDLDYFEEQYSHEHICIAGYDTLAGNEQPYVPYLVPGDGWISALDVVDNSGAGGAVAVYNDLGASSIAGRADGGPQLAAAVAVTEGDQLWLRCDPQVAATVHLRVKHRRERIV